MPVCQCQDWPSKRPGAVGQFLGLLRALHPGPLARVCGQCRFQLELDWRCKPNNEVIPAQRCARLWAAVPQAVLRRPHAVGLADPRGPSPCAVMLTCTSAGACGRKACLLFANAGAQACKSSQWAASSYQQGFITCRSPHRRSTHSAFRGLILAIGSKARAS